MMRNKALYILIVCSLIGSCATIPTPSSEETAILQRAREDLIRGDYEWVLYDMKKFFQEHPGSVYTSEAHFLTGSAAKGQVDTARIEKKLTGLFLTSYTAPLMQQAYANYIQAFEKSMSEEAASEALYSAALMLDIGYMNLFKEALTVYGEIILKFPGTIWAGKAQIRYDNLDEKFRTLKAGPHSITGDR